VTVTAEVLAQMLAPAPAPLARIGDPPGRCRTCTIPLDAILIDRPDRTGLHHFCQEPAPIPTLTAPAAPASPFSAPAGPPPPHPIKQELIDIIRWAAADAPRSRQAAVGPSEIGVDCMRRLAYRLTGTQPVNTAADPWFSIVGLAVHDWLDIAINQYNAKVLGPPNGSRTFEQRRYWTEQRLTMSSDQFGLSGNCDVYDLDRATPVDHKIVGHDALKKYRDSGPSNQYRTQIHSYGYGWELKGFPVREVAIAFYPRSGYLTDMHVWAEPYDRQIALNALSRAASVKQLAAVLPPALLPDAPDPDACTWCPFYRPGGPADTTGCPGPLKTN
jgi:hypothetical protein